MSLSQKAGAYIQFSLYRAGTSVVVAYHRMKYAFLITFIITLSIQSFALQKVEIVKLTSKTMALPLAPHEASIKHSLIKMFLFNKPKFMELKKDSENNSDVYQSYIEEVYEHLNSKNITEYDPDEGLYNQFMKNSKIDLAKKVAKYQMLMMIQKNWNMLKTTIFNEEGVETWKLARLFTIKKLNEILVFVPQHTHAKTHFLFLFGQNFVQIDKNALKTVRIGLDINSRLDSNTLPPEAANIIADDANEKSMNKKSLTNPYNSKSETKSKPTDNHEQIDNTDNSNNPEFNDLEIF